MLTGFEKLFDRYGIVAVAPLLKGWSNDKKYILEDNNGKRYILTGMLISLIYRFKLF